MGRNIEEEKGGELVREGGRESKTERERKGSIDRGCDRDGDIHKVYELIASSKFI